MLCAISPIRMQIGYNKAEDGSGQILLISTKLMDNAMKNFTWKGKRN